MNITLMINVKSDKFDGNSFLKFDGNFHNENLKNNYNRQFGFLKYFIEI